MPSAIFPWTYLSLLETFHVTHFFQHRDSIHHAPLSTSYHNAIDMCYLEISTDPHVLPPLLFALVLQPHPAFTGHTSVSDLVYVNKNLVYLVLKQKGRRGWNRAVGWLFLIDTINLSEGSLNSEAKPFWWKSFQNIAPSTPQTQPCLISQAMLRAPGYHDSCGFSPYATENTLVLIVDGTYLLEFEAGLARWKQSKSQNCMAFSFCSSFSWAHCLWATQLVCKVRFSIARCFSGFVHCHFRVTFPDPFI